MQNEGEAASAAAGSPDGGVQRPRGRQLKEVLIEAGLDLLHEDGLALNADTISYANVFAHLESNYGVRVTRASVHERIWSSHDDFRREVLASSIPHLIRPSFQRNPGGMASDAVAAADTSEPQDRINRFSRVAAPLIFAGLLNAPASAKLQAVKVVASRSNDPLATETLGPLLQSRTRQNVKTVRAGFRDVIVMLGLKPRADLELPLPQLADLFHDLMGTLTIGGMLDHRSGSQNIITPIDFGGVPSDAEHAWTPLSIGFASLLAFLFVDDADSELAVEDIPDAPPQEPPDFQIDQDLFDSPRRSREELKKLVLAAGVELFLGSSLDLRPDSLSYAAVFERVKRDRGIVVNRGSVHKRIWSSHDDFRFEVLSRALWRTGQPTKELKRIFELTSPTKRDDGTIDRHLTAAAILRSVGEAQFEVTMQSTEYHQLLQVKGALEADHDTPGAIALREAVEKADGDRVARYSRQMQASILDLGFVIRPELAITAEEGRDLFSLLAITSIAGATLDRMAGMTSIVDNVGLTEVDGGKPERWTTLGLILRAHFETLFVDPDL